MALKTLRKSKRLTPSVSAKNFIDRADLSKFPYWNFFRCVRNEAKYEKARVDIKQKVLNYEGPKLVEQMQSTIRNYIVKEKEEKGSFPEIPDEEDGGSRSGEH